MVGDILIIGNLCCVSAFNYGHYGIPLNPQMHREKMVKEKKKKKKSKKNKKHHSDSSDSESEEKKKEKLKKVSSPSGMS